MKHRVSNVKDKQNIDFEIVGSAKFLADQYHFFINRGRSFVRITFLRNSSDVLSKFVSKEKIRSFEFRAICGFLSKVVCSKIFRFSNERYSNEKMLI